MGGIRRTCAGCGESLFFDMNATPPFLCKKCRQAKHEKELTAIVDTIRSKLGLDSEVDPVTALTELFASYDEDTRRRESAERRLEELTTSLSIKLTGAMLRSPDQIEPLVDELIERHNVAIAKLRSAGIAVADIWKAAQTVQQTANALQFEALDLSRFDKTLAQAVSAQSSQSDLQPDD